MNATDYELLCRDQSRELARLQGRLDGCRKKQQDVFTAYEGALDRAIAAEAERDAARTRADAACALLTETTDTLATLLQELSWERAESEKEHAVVERARAFLAESAGTES